MTIAMTEDEAVMLRQRIGELDAFVGSVPSAVTDLENRQSQAIKDRDTFTAILEDAGFSVDPDDV